MLGQRLSHHKPVPRIAVRPRERGRGHGVFE